MLHWWMTNKTKISKKKSRESEKSFILSKVPASVKSTTVNVTIEDNYEKEQVAQSSASLSLSVELSKPIEIIQKPDAYHPIRRKQSLLVHSKVAPVTFSTSISASGNLSEEVLRSTRAIDYLTKEIEKDDIISHQPIANDLCQQSDIESTCDQNGLLNWLKKLREDGADDKLERHDSSIDIDYKNKTDSIRLSPSNNSLKRQDNQVLPTFNSLFIPEQEQTNNYHNLLVKTINAINAYLIPPKEQIINSHWFANKMKDKFEHFVQDIKSLDKRMDPRIVIIGVHGWFPMKVIQLNHSFSSLTQTQSLFVA